MQLLCDVNCRTICETTLYVNIVTKVMTPVKGCTYVTQAHSEVGYSPPLSITYSYNIITVPEHTVSLHSNSPKLTPILSESSFTLTCTVELNPSVDVPVTINTVWTGPDGTILTSATRPEKKSFTLYASVNTVHSVDSADSGNYTCTVSVEDGVEVSASTNITIGIILYDIVIPY